MMSRSILAAVLLLLLATGAWTLLASRASSDASDAKQPAFTPPDAATRKAAVGSIDRLAPSLRRAFTADDMFSPIDKPGPHDWLANHPEPGRTFDEYVKSRPNRPDKLRSRIYLQPLGAFDKDAPPLDELAAFTKAFFMMDVVVQPPLDIKDANITSRINPHTKSRQLLSTDILDLLKRKLPDDAFCRLGITMTDLYPEPSWNYVFGQASLRGRVGVYSFARYDPAFFGEEVSPEQRDAIMLQRSCSVLAHEAGHMFSLYHCIYFNCLMNGSNHLAESDSRPLHLCPVCLRKLHHALNFDPATRYTTLERFADKHKWEKEAKWLKKRRAFVAGEED